MSSQPSPFVDHAANILQNAAGIDDNQRADLHDAFYNKNANELAQHLQTLMVPDQLKTDLYDTKKRFSIGSGAPSAPATGPVSKAAEALTALSNLEPRVLELAETHPKMATAFIAAATKEALAPAAPSQSVDEGVGSKAPAVASGSPAGATEPLPGGLPRVPSRHARVLASDGGIHDIPQDNLAKAQAIDPKLKVMHLEP